MQLGDRALVYRTCGPHFVLVCLSSEYGLAVLPWPTRNLLDWAGLDVEGQPAHLPSARTVEPCTTTPTSDLPADHHRRLEPTTTIATRW